MIMHHSTPPDDELSATLDLLSVPEPSAHAQARLVQFAQQHTRRTPAPFKWLRLARACFAVPPIRYAVMASVVGFFMLVGLIAPSQPTTKAESDILAAITFDEEDPLGSFWVAGL